MKKLLLMLLCSFTAVLFAAPDGWMTDLDAALAKAKESKKSVLILVTGSDWCPPCQRLYKDVIPNGAFKKFADKSLVLLYVDLPRQRKATAAEEKLLRDVAVRYNISGGVPNTTILNSNGKKLGSFAGYGGDCNDYIYQVKRLMRRK